jgi:hypothetical protein
VSERRCGQCPHFGRRTRSYIGPRGSDSAYFRNFPVFPRFRRQFESHLGHSVSARQTPVSSLGVDKPAQSVDSGVPFLVWQAFGNAPEKDGSSSYMVLWRDPKSREQQGLTVATIVEAETLKRLLDANGQSSRLRSMPSSRTSSAHRQWLRSFRNTSTC